ncbi:MAG TPA: hypothetical protein VKM55_28265 [Candidatus Lokiarchaeia archaeon]|nr:hypothetical protein [Candidatus Lokiarchaeia archaeon]
MALRKQPASFGILFKDDVLYTSDLDLRPIFDLAKFSVSFAQNLVRDSQLSEFIHEPSMALQQGDVKRAHAEGKLNLITREHVLFKELTNKAGETIFICTTYPSNEDLKNLDIVDLTPEQLRAQARAFLDALAEIISNSIDFDNIVLENYTQEQILGIHQIMYDLHDDIAQASQVIFRDMHPQIERETPEPDCTFLFASVMHSSVPCASRFFENMESFFKVRIDSDTTSVSSIVENLISAQLSTIVTSSLSIAKTMIREVELKVKGTTHEENLHITFYPIKNNYSLVLIAKGNSETLRFFTEAQANILANLDALDENFTGELSCFESSLQSLQSIPPSIESQSKDMDFDDMVEDLDMHLALDEKRKDDEPESIDDDDLQFNKIKPKLFKAQIDINVAISENRVKIAAKRAKDLLSMASKIKNELLVIYYEKKFRALSKNAKR